MVEDGLIEVVGTVLRLAGSDAAPVGVVNVLRLAQIGEGDKVTVVLRRGRFVGHPQFHALQCDAAGDGRKRTHPAVVVVAEVMREPEVAVLFVVDGRDLVVRRLCAAFRADAL